MKVVWAFVVAISVVATSVTAGGLGAECIGDSVRFNIWAYGVFEDPSTQRLGIRASIDGECDSGYLANTTPIDYPQYLDWENTVHTFPAKSPGRYVRYQLVRIDSEGNEFPLPDSGDGQSWTLEACTTEAIFTRGVLWNFTGAVTLIVCDGHCWEFMDFRFDEAEVGWESLVNSGQVVNVYGEAYVNGIPGGTYLKVSRVEPVVDASGCDAVSEEMNSWGSVKATYR